MRSGTNVPLFLLAGLSAITAFSPPFATRLHPTFIQQSQHAVLERHEIKSKTLLHAGGFEWEDPEKGLDQGVENPFKKAIDDSAEGGMKIDPARLLAPRLEGVNLYFIGMMGAGKSAVGDRIARRMGSYNFLDTDKIIEQVTNMTIPEIFASEGEESFREIESKVLNSIHSYVRCVISTGGGIVCQLSNWSKLQSGIVVFLDVDPETIMTRIQGTDRPLLQTDDPLSTLTDLLNERKSRYEQCDLKVEVTDGMSLDETADAVIKGLHNFIDENPPAFKLAQQRAEAESLE